MSTVGTIRVLHVDDDPSFADLVATFLEREHDRINVHTESDPSDGLDRLAEQEFDCVVSDYDMPSRNGIEFLEAVRDRNPDLPFILFTGKGSEEIASDAISAGVTDYLQKGSGTSQYVVLANRISNAVEQHRARQVVQETEQKLSELADRTDDLLFMFNGDWSELLFINSAYEEIWGRSIADLEDAPSSFLDLIHPEDRQKVRQSMEQLSNGNSSQIEYRVVRPEGDYRWVRGDSKPVLNEQGDVVRIVGHVRDITDQRERELHLKTIIDNLPGYVYRHEYESEYPLQFVKGDAESITGYTTTELEENIRLAEEIIHPDDREDIWTELLEGIEARGRFDSTYRIIAKDGDVRWIRDQGTLIEDPATGNEVIDGFITDISSQIERERRLERQQTFMDESLDALQDVYYVVSEDGELIRWNERVSEISGYADSELDNIDISALFVEEHRERITDSIDEAIQTGASTTRADALTVDGERIPFEFRKTRVRDPVHGEAVAVGVGRDISEQVQRERELERIRDFFTEAEQLGELGAWEFSTDGTVVWTDGTRRIHDVDPEFTPTLEEALEFFHPEDRETIEQAVTTALERGESYEADLRINTAEGDQRWIRTRAKVLDGADPRTVRGFVQNITAQKEREQELQTAHAQLENAIEAGALGTWEWHIQEDRVVVDREFANTFDVDPDRAQDGVELNEFVSSIHTADRDRVEAEIDETVETCGDFESEYRVLDADGDVRWVLARGTVNGDADGTPLSFPGVLIDITERKRMERELHQQNERLNEFAGVVSHDLRSPLSVIEGRVELARGDGENEHLPAIESAVDRMNRIIEDLLWLAREGRDIGSLEPVSLRDTVEDAWAIVGDPAADATMNYGDEDGDRGLIKADSDRLTQLLENLFRNAIEHGGDDVRVTVGFVDDGFYVEDDGPGIPDDDRDTVFEAGYSTAESGTGFGLRIVKQIVEAHGWEIRVTRGRDGGARFEVTGVEFDG
ncbi:hybrid sensor histidine kinase/response regulator [Halorubrum salipaludis]|uniref:histidine kinase n=1 Tax=Halorubrum salipaludis TaxID=2032630 RepID=A0A2A2FEB1_9EURY|nr:PAS domain-containing protein [Halorubrum salipaludis]PAU82939.1 hybrid sensor histidine kinase/response regulator [Halorubrum salipaludis]